MSNRLRRLAGGQNRDVATDDLTGWLREALLLAPGATEPATAAALHSARQLRESADRAVLAVADGRLPASGDVTPLNRSAAAAPRPALQLAVTDDGLEAAGTTTLAPTPHPRRPHRPRRRRAASVPRDPARMRLRGGSLRTALPGPQPPLVLHVPLRKPHQGPPLSGPFTTERRADGRLTEESSAHSDDLIRKAGPGTLSMSCACTGWPSSQRIWTSTCAPHSRCRATTAGPSGSAR